MTRFATEPRNILWKDSGRGGMTYQVATVLLAYFTISGCASREGPPFHFQPAQSSEEATPRACGAALTFIFSRLRIGK
jgi:hypothetical protein